MKLPLSFTCLSVVLFETVPSVAFDEDAVRLAQGEGFERPYYATVGAGTGSLYGGKYGMGAEFGYEQVSLVVGAGMDLPAYDFTVADGPDAKSPAPPSFNWRLALKGYLGGEEMRFRPFLAALYGPLKIYDIDWYGRHYSGTKNCFGAAAGFDYDPFGKRGILLTAGISAMAKTSTVPDSVDNIVEDQKGSPTAFIYPWIEAAVGYRF